MDNLLDGGNSSTFETSSLENTVSKPQLWSSIKKKVQTTSFQDALLDAITNPPLYFQTPPEVDDPDKASISQSTSQPQNVFNIPSNSNGMTPTFPYPCSYK
ncbi:hypothetical protein FWK35_00009849 [Aphis craccivora]|uniref:Uncharacterized protein n=1 Tax=Aphis craccivora TaxID=307492 RepID=A0A6G0YG02_APHCR|nr:hypothetical protein FWK35_00009849 [Aphis craccivora]